MVLKSTLKVLISCIFLSVIKLPIIIAKPKLPLCVPTKIEINDYEPETFKKSNNLLRSPGQEVVVQGQKIIIHGKVQDQYCKPVKDAKIYIWQANSNGLYSYKPLKDIIDSNFIKIDSRSTFTGNGIATTNNHGEFTFITIYPQAIHDLPPHINIRVIHKMFHPLQSILRVTNNNLASASVIENLRANDDLDYINLSVYDFSINIHKRKINHEA
jgi:protocatechuate 3,4-dioxygenase beta subunit